MARAIKKAELKYWQIHPATYLGKSSVCHPRTENKQK